MTEKGQGLGTGPRNHSALTAADGMGRTPRRPVVAENIRDLQHRTGHSRGRLRRRRLRGRRLCVGLARVVLRLPGLLARLSQQVERALNLGDHKRFSALARRVNDTRFRLCLLTGVHRTKT